MTKISRVFGAFSAAFWLASGAAAQTFPAVGTRAGGMGGAFVAVADDASAIYWNPGALAAGSYFSLVVDGGAASAAPELSLRGEDGSSFFLGLAMPALGLGYYRLHDTTVVAPVVLLPVGGELSSRDLSAVAELRLDTLITHHAGITLVQSVTPGVSVGTTLKLVRGIAASTTVAAASAEQALETDAAELLGRATNRLDLDVGILAAGGPLRVGLTLRNLRQPSFEAAGNGVELTLERQARAGLSYAVGGNWVAAADFDLLRTRDAFGPRRDIALGTEGRLGSRVLVRGGVSVNTVDEEGAGRIDRRAYSAGGSFAAKASVYVDGQFTTGTDRAGWQWGLAARFVY